MSNDPITSIDVSDLPEEMRNALAEQAEQLRRCFVTKKESETSKPRELGVYPGRIVGNLTREEIYAGDE